MPELPVGLTTTELVEDLKQIVYIGIGDTLGDAIATRFLKSERVKKYAGLIRVVIGVIVAALLAKRVTGEAAKVVKGIAYGIGAGGISQIVSSFIKKKEVTEIEVGTAEEVAVPEEVSEEEVSPSEEEKYKVALF